MSEPLSVEERQQIAQRLKVDYWIFRPHASGKLWRDVPQAIRDLERLLESEAALREENRRLREALDSTRDQLNEALRLADCPLASHCPLMPRGR